MSTGQPPATRPATTIPCAQPGSRSPASWTPSGPRTRRSRPPLTPTRHRRPAARVADARRAAATPVRRRTQPPTARRRLPGNRPTRPLLAARAGPRRPAGRRRAAGRPPRPVGPGSRPVRAAPAGGTPATGGDAASATTNTSAVEAPTSRQPAGSRRRWREARPPLDTQAGGRETRGRLAGQPADAGTAARRVTPTATARHRLPGNRPTRPPLAARARPRRPAGRRRAAGRPPTRPALPARRRPPRHAGGQPRSPRRLPGNRQTPAPRPRVMPTATTRRRLPGNRPTPPPPAARARPRRQAGRRRAAGRPPTRPALPERRRPPRHAGGQPRSPRRLPGNRPTPAPRPRVMPTATTRPRVPGNRPPRRRPPHPGQSVEDAEPGVTTAPQPRRWRDESNPASWSRRPRTSRSGAATPKAHPLPSGPDPSKPRTSAAPWRSPRSRPTNHLPATSGPVPPHRPRQQRRSSAPARPPSSRRHHPRTREGKGPGQGQGPLGRLRSDRGAAAHPHRQGPRRRRPVLPPRVDGRGIIALVVAVAMTWPTLRYPRHTIPQDFWDPTLQAWQMAWSGHILLTDPGQLWHANAFYPELWSFAFSDTLLGYAPLGMIGEGPTAAVLRYNIVFVLAHALAAVRGVRAGPPARRQPHRGRGRRGGVRVRAVAALAGRPPARDLQRRHPARAGHARPRPRLLVPARLPPERRHAGWALAGWLVAAWQLSLGFGIGLAVRVRAGAARLGASSAGSSALPGPGGRRPFGPQAVLRRPGRRRDLRRGRRPAGDSRTSRSPSSPVRPAQLRGDRALLAAGARLLHRAAGVAGSGASLHAAVRATLDWAPEMTLLPGFMLFGLALAGLLLPSLDAAAAPAAARCSSWSAASSRWARKASAASSPTCRCYDHAARLGRLRTPGPAGDVDDAAARHPRRRRGAARSPTGSRRSPPAGSRRGRARGCASRR